MIEHCISLFKKEHKEKTYRIYITDTLQAIANNSAGGDKRMTIPKRWIEIVEPKEIKETRSGKQIIEDIKRKVKGG